MKRYEIASKEEILKAFESTLICANCILNSKCDEATCDYHVPCNKRIIKYFYEEIVPKTKADNIRTMSDEELASWLVIIEQRILERQPMLERPALYQDWIEWLKQPAKI